MPVDGAFHSSSSSLVLTGDWGWWPLQVEIVASNVGRTDDRQLTVLCTCCFHCRAACTEMGCTVGLASSPMSGKTAKQVCLVCALAVVGCVADLAIPCSTIMYRASFSKRDLSYRAMKMH